MIKRRGLLPRTTVQGRRIVEVRNEFNEVISLTPTTFQVNRVTIQPFVGDKLSPDLNGYQNMELYTVFTETPLQIGIEGSTRKADEININGSWYRVVAVKQWGVGVIPHYECVCAKMDQGLL